MVAGAAPPCAACPAYPACSWRSRKRSASAARAFCFVSRIVLLRSPLKATRACQTLRPLTLMDRSVQGCGPKPRACYQHAAGRLYVIPCGGVAWRHQRAEVWASGDA
jgi:hypothetical protein